jgi:transcription elongation factor GreA
MGREGTGRRAISASGFFSARLLTGSGARNPRPESNCAWRLPQGERQEENETMEKIPMTAAGHATLEAELKHCQAVERPRIIQQITDARTHGDLSENAEYHAAKEQQSLNEGRIAEIEDKLARAEIIDVSKLSGDTIKFGATVTLVDEDTDEKRVWQIVGEPEADAKKGRISITSPIARALIGKTKGSTVEVNTPGGARATRSRRSSGSNFSSGMNRDGRAGARPFAFRAGLNRPRLSMSGEDRAR